MQTNKQQRARKKFARSFSTAATTVLRELLENRRDEEGAALVPIILRYSMVADGAEPSSNADSHIARAHVAVDLLKLVPNSDVGTVSPTTRGRCFPLTRGVLWERISLGILSGRAEGEDLTRFLSALLEPRWFAGQELKRMAALFAPKTEHDRGGQWRRIDREMSTLVINDLKRVKRKHYQADMMRHIVRAVPDEVYQALCA